MSSRIVFWGTVHPRHRTLLLRCLAIFCIYVGALSLSRRIKLLFLPMVVYATIGKAPENMQLRSVYLGIDVACAAGKQLPICVISADDSRTPLVVPKPLANLVPRGLGNREVFSRAPFRDVADQVAVILKRVASEMGWLVERIAVDAPAAPGTFPAGTDRAPAVAR
jgi:hypothetical protein